LEINTWTNGMRANKTCRPSSKQYDRVSWFLGGRCNKIWQDVRLAVANHSVFVGRCNSSREYESRIMYNCNTESSFCESSFSLKMCFRVGRPFIGS
jgi:hypothetical protein